MTTFTVVDDLEPLVDGTDWAEIELADGRGRGTAAWFALEPGGNDPIASIERLTSRPDPLLAAVAEYGVDDGEGYVAWSGTIDETLASLSGPLTMAEIVTLADVLLAGFERLHASGFVHPGLTPELVRLSTDDAGRVVPDVLGFGLPAPGRTTRDDLVDVGFLLYRLYTGRDAYEPDQARDGSVTPQSFASARPGVVAPAAFESAVLRAIGPAERRFVTAGEMRSALAVAPARRTGYSARPTATTDPHMRRALKSGVVGLEALLAPEVIPAPEDRYVPARPDGGRRFGLVQVAGLAALTLVLGFVIGRATGGSSAAPTAMVAEATTPSIAPSPELVAAPSITQPATPATSPEATRVAVVGDALGGAADKVAMPEPASDVPAEAKAEPPPPVAPTGTTHLTVVSDPPGATVLVRGRKLVQKAPFTIDVTAEWLPIELVFDKRKFFPRREFVEKLTGPSMTVEVRLKGR